MAHMPQGTRQPAARRGDIGQSGGPSRLGASREGTYYTGLEDFRKLQDRLRIGRIETDFPTHWSTGDDSRGSLDENLDRAARAEFGFGLREIAEFVGILYVLGDSSVDEPTSLPLADIQEAAHVRGGWPRERVLEFVDHFALRGRDEFIPRGKESEVYPWRFNRELSYLRRPLIVHGAQDGYQLVWGRRHLDRFGPTLVNLVLTGRLRAESHEMKRFISRARAKEAEAFNDIVAERLEGRPGLIVRRRVERIGRLPIERSPGQPLGDIDVLAADARKRILNSIEVKNFEVAKTPFEVGNELTKLFAGERSTVARHLERARWVEDHVPEVCEWLGVGGNRGRWRVKSHIVISRPLLSPYLRPLSANM